MIYQLRINQRVAQELGLFEKGIDGIDLAIFDAIKWLCKASFTKKAVKDDSLYVLIDWKLLMAQIPSITITSYRGWKKRLDKLVEVELIQPHADNQKTAQSWYRLTHLADRFDSDATASTYENKFRGNAKPMNESADPYEQKCRPPMNESADYITHSINTEETHNKIHDVDSFETEKAVLTAYNKLADRNIVVDLPSNIETVTTALKWIKNNKKELKGKEKSYLIEYMEYRKSLSKKNGGFMADDYFCPETMFRKTRLKDNFATFETKRDTNRTYTSEEISDIGLDSLAEGLNAYNYKSRLDMAMSVINTTSNQAEHAIALEVINKIKSISHQKQWV